MKTGTADAGGEQKETKIAEAECEMVTIPCDSKEELALRARTTTAVMERILTLPVPPQRTVPRSQVR